MATRASYVYIYNSMVEFSGASQKCKFYAIFSENSWFQRKIFTGLLVLVQLYKQNSLEQFFIFTIYQNYTLALKLKTHHTLCTLPVAHSTCSDIEGRSSHRYQSPLCLYSPDGCREKATYIRLIIHKTDDNI